MTEFMTGPYLGVIVDSVKDAIPKVVDRENAYWLYQGELPSFRSFFRNAVVGTSDALSTIHPNYLLVAATMILVFCILYIKIKYPFWNQIPALHVYDWHRRMLYPEKPYIIHLLPKKTKYYESKFVETLKFSEMKFEQKTELAKLLQNHYLASDRVFCSIQVPDLTAQFAYSLVSIYCAVEENISLNLENGHETQQLLVDRQIVNRIIKGFVSSRRINIAISLGKLNERYIVHDPACFIDYLCFDRTNVSNDRIRNLFHTHEYNKRCILPDRNITLFKKEVELCDALVPLVEYESLSFYLRYRIEPSPFPSNFQVIRIQREHLQYLHDWMERVVSLKSDIGFRVSLAIEIGDLIHLLQTNQMFAYALRGPDTIFALYFFRNAHMKYEDLDGGDTLHATTAFCNTNNFDVYFQGFLHSLREARKDFTGTETKMLMIDDIGHLRGIVRRWITTHDVVLKTKCAYYFCNYVLPRSPYKPEEVNILL